MGALYRVVNHASSGICTREPCGRYSKERVDIRSVNNLLLILAVNAQFLERIQRAHVGGEDLARDIQVPEVIESRQES